MQNKDNDKTKAQSISFDVTKYVDQRPADTAIQETNKDGKHVSWHISPHQDTEVKGR